MKKFGRALDFYRLRLVKFSEEDGLDFDWDSEILYRPPKDYIFITKTYFSVQAVNLDTKAVFELKRFKTAEEALRYKDKAEEWLRELTKKEFEERFLPNITPSA